MTQHEQPSRAPGTGRGRRAALIVVVTIALICGAVATGYLWAFSARTDRARAAELHQVTATTTGPAQDPPVQTRSGTGPRAVAPAVWEYPDDVSRSGTVDVPPRTPRGRSVTVWVDDAGAPVRRLDNAADRWLTSVVGGIATAGAVGATGAAALALLRRRAEGRALAALEREWERVEPVWSGRLRRERGPGADED
ncbi:hypothetical protein [Streptomyces sp. NPDC093105]|uniref:Rv1733c family protein n=1 Tax=Streptomyces sp. NPDC093105 TaxID=3366029 RepID=UPI003813679F